MKKKKEKQNKTIKLLKSLNAQTDTALFGLKQKKKLR